MVTSLRRYATDELTVEIRGSGSADGLRLNIEHASGAALIVPRAETSEIEGGARVVTQGFDGTEYTVDILDASVVVSSSGPSPILGGGTRLEVARVAITKDNIGPLRVTGDEETMPIQVGDD